MESSERPAHIEVVEIHGAGDKTDERPTLRLKIKNLKGLGREQAKPLIPEGLSTSPPSQEHSKNSSGDVYQIPTLPRLLSPFTGDLPAGLEPGWQLPAVDSSRDLTLDILSPDGSTDSIHSSSDQHRLPASNGPGRQQFRSHMHASRALPPRQSSQHTTPFASLPQLDHHISLFSAVPAPEASSRAYAHPPVYGVDMRYPPVQPHLPNFLPAAAGQPIALKGVEPYACTPGLWQQQPHNVSSTFSGVTPVPESAWSQSHPQQQLPKTNSLKRKRSSNLPPGSTPAMEASHPGKPGTRELMPYEIVWAKLGSHPWWPAQVQHPNEQHLRLKHRPTDVFVVFYGDCNFAWLPAAGVQPFAAEYRRRSAGSSKKLQGAVDAAWAALGLPRPRQKNAQGTLMLPEQLSLDRPMLPYLPP